MFFFNDRDNLTKTETMAERLKKGGHLKNKSSSLEGRLGTETFTLFRVSYSFSLELGRKRLGRAGAGTDKFRNARK